MEIEKVEELEKEIVKPDAVTLSDTNKENVSEKKSEGITITSGQQDLIKAIAKLDLEIEAVNNQTINEDDFYDKLDETLTDEEKYLQEENPKEYLKIIAKKREEYFKTNSNDFKKQELNDKKNDLELRYKIEDGVVEVTKLYKDYNHIEMQTFFQRKLTHDERDDIINGSNNVGEVFKKTYEKYLEKSGKGSEIKNIAAPTTPNLSIVKKESIKPNQITAIDSEDDKYKRALGV